MNQTVDIVLAALMIIGGVIGAQIGAKLATNLKGEYLRGVLALIVLAVCVKITFDLTLTPKDIYSLLRSNTDQYDIIMVRDYNYLKWRFISNPDKYNIWIVYYRFGICSRSFI